MPMPGPLQTSYATTHQITAPSAECRFPARAADTLAEVAHTARGADEPGYR